MKPYLGAFAIAASLLVSLSASSSSRSPTGPSSAKR
jgi:hypothetical protein